MVDLCGGFHGAQSATLTARGRWHDEGGGTRLQEVHDRSLLPAEDGPVAIYFESYYNQTFMGRV
jgi:hypothetical protein|tara:strand:+ start:7302 stop:7493 length:192 start_codon:yes stop_codon:yes gene_type:complete